MCTYTDTHTDTHTEDRMCTRHCAGSWGNIDNVSDLTVLAVERGMQREKKP